MPPTIPELVPPLKRPSSGSPDPQPLQHHGHMTHTPTELSDMVDEWLRGPLSGPPCSLVVWDFDMTVLRIHAFGRRIEPEQVAARWERDIADKDLFVLFVSTARSRGIHVGIASFGRAEVVQEYMREIFRDNGGPAFSPDLIVPPAALGARDGTSVVDGKPRMLQMLSSRCSPPVTDRARVLFFDDDGDNIADCVRAGYRAVHTPAAFTRVALEELAVTHLAGTNTSPDTSKSPGTSANTRELIQIAKSKSDSSLEPLGARGGFLPADAPLDLAALSRAPDLLLKQAPAAPPAAPAAPPKAPAPPPKAPDAPLKPQERQDAQGWSDTKVGPTPTAPGVPLAHGGASAGPVAAPDAPTSVHDARPAPPLQALAAARLASLCRRFGDRQKPAPRNLWRGLCDKNLCNTCFQPIIGTTQAKPALRVRRTSFNSAIAASSSKAPDGPLFARHTLPSGTVSLPAQPSGGPEIAM